MNLFEELDNELEEAYSPHVQMRNPQPVGTQDVLVGHVANDQNIKTLYGLALQIEDKIKDLRDEHDALCPPEPGDEERHDELLFQLSDADAKHKIVSNAMWIAIRRKFKTALTGRKHLGLRENWFVVYVDDEPSPVTQLVLGDLLSNPFMGSYPLSPPYFSYADLVRRQLGLQR